MGSTQRRGAGTMSRQELEELRQYILRTQRARTATKEIARQQLEREGVITPHGELTEQYGGPRAA